MSNQLNNQVDDRLLDVNEFGVLRIPAVVWLALLFLSRHWIMAFVVFISSLMSRETLRVLGGDFNWVALAVELPAVLVLWACAYRRPEAGRFIRTLWSYARHLAAGTALLHLGYVVWYLWNSSYWLPWPELFLASCALIDLAIIQAIFRSTLLKQIFTEFPVAIAKSTSSLQVPKP